MKLFPHPVAFLPISLSLALVSAAGLGNSVAQTESESLPVSGDPNLEIVKFAGSDLVQQPTGLDFDHQGRLLVICSHTHFRPEGYEGPPSDQILWLQDTDGDGQADKKSVYFEGLTHAMDLAVHPETGAVYVATRDEILRLRDDDGDGVADPDKVERKLVYLDTEGDYPHNAISGLAFDANGDLFFGMGENLGATYKLIGSDGTSFEDEGEGGNIWWMTKDGAQLRRVATGFWNPFGVCVDWEGRVFATDNDPSSRPPCRLHYVIEGGNHGYLFRYGRSGLHPFVAWDGELTGTLPMLCGSGEAPCDVISYLPRPSAQYRGLAERYWGNLLVASWADHSIERYQLAPKGGTFESKREVIVQGGVEFRPVAFATASDGSLFVSDWVKRDYNLHHYGAIWHLRAKTARPVEKVSVEDLPKTPQHLLIAEIPRVRDGDRLLGLLDRPDAYVFGATVHQLGKLPEVLGELLADPDLSDRQRTGLMLALRESDPKDDGKKLPRFLEDPNEEIRLLAFKWVSDEKLGAYRARLETEAAHPSAPVLFHAAVTALARLDETNTDDKSIQRLISAQLLNEATDPTARQAAFMILENRAQLLSSKELIELLDGSSDPEFRSVVLLTLGQKGEKAAGDKIAAVAAAATEPESVRAMAVTALGGFADDYVPALLRLAADSPTSIREEAFRSIKGASLTDAQKTELESLDLPAGLAALRDRALGKVYVPQGQPSPNDTAGWEGYLAALDGAPDPAAGQRIFHHSRLVNCATCHRAEGLGRTGGPDLSTIGERGRRHIIDSILDPSKEVAPQYEAWQINLADGTQKIGFLLREEGGNHTYADIAGNEFKIMNRDIANRRALPVSLMPLGLATLLTAEEFRDLVAFLEGLRRS